MVKTCCIQFCKSESYVGCGISFHSFPKDEKVNQMWLNVIPLSKKIKQNSVVCSRHFKKEDFYVGNSRLLLKAEVIPSIFPPVPNKQIHVLSNIVIQPSTPGTSKESSVSEDYTPPTKKFCSGIKDATVQTEKHFSIPSEDMLKRKVKVLSLRLKRRDIRLDNLKSLLVILKKKKQQLS